MMARVPALAHIGAGRFSRAAHGPTLRRLADQTPARLTLNGIADVDETRPERARQFCKDFGYQTAYQRVDDLIHHVRPDLVVCVVETARTATVVADLLPGRVPLLVEKPPGESAADAARLATLARKHRTLHYVAFNRRRVPFVESARRWLRELGPPRYVRAEMLRQGRRTPNFAVATGIHAVDTLRYLAGDMIWMEAAHATSGSSRPPSRDYRARVFFESGCEGDIVLAMDGGLTRESYLFEYGRSLRLEVTMGAPYSDPSVWAGFRVTQGHEVRLQEPAATDPLVAMGIVGEHDAFLSAVESGRQPDCSFADAWKSMMAAEGLERAHRGPLPREPYAEVVPAEERPVDSLS